MKNKKIITLTVFAVVIVLVGILGLSKFFETSWQNENTVDNSLNAEIVDNVENVFDYPYVNYTQLNDDEKYVYNDFFYNIIDFIIPENKEFTYQQAANKAGEAIKYLTGYTEHQKKPMVIELTNVNMFSLSRQLSKDCYNCVQRVQTDSGELSIVAIIDVTGQFWYVGFEDTDVKSGGYGYKTTPPQDISEQLLDVSLQFLQELDATDKIVGYEIKKAHSDKDIKAGGVYVVALKTEDSKTLLFTLNEEYGLVYFSRYHEEIPFDYIMLQ